MKILSRPVIIGFLTILFFLLVLLLFSDALGQDKDPVRQQLFAAINETIQRAVAEQVPLLAPRQYEKGYRLYQKALDRYGRGDKMKNIQQDLAEAAAFFKSADETARVNRVALDPVLQWRQQIVRHGLDKQAPESFAATEEMLLRIIERAEEGDLKSARDDFPGLHKQYRLLAVQAYREGILKSVSKNMEARKKSLNKTQYQKTATALDDMKYWLNDQADESFEIDDFINRADARIRVSIEDLYPSFYKNLPDTLLIGPYTLYVTSYGTKGNYDFSRDAVTQLEGTARFSLHCGGFTLTPYLPGARLVSQVFRVVDQVLSPEKEISLQDARLINPMVMLGKDISLEIPAKSSSKSDIIAAKKDLLGRYKPGSVLKMGEYSLRFKEVSIIEAERPTIGRIIEGYAYYPAATGAKPIEVALQGFTVLIDSLHIAPDKAMARARLGLPPSLVAEKGCARAALNLGLIEWPSDCQIYREYPDSSYGAFLVDPTGQKITGLGYIVDLSTSQSPPGLSLANSWQGVIFKNGNTVSTASVVANTGYLMAPYQYGNALVTATGIKTRMTLSAPYTFRPLTPHGYEIAFNSGFLDLDSSAVVAGEMGNGKIVMPKTAAWANSPGTPPRASFTKLLVQRDLDLAGPVVMTDPLQWGELTHPGDELAAYSAKVNSSATDYAFFYLKGGGADHFVPKTDADFEVSWGTDPTVKLEERGITGVTVIFFSEFNIFTPDVPGSPLKSISFYEDTKSSLHRSWLNVDGPGVNGRIVVRIDSVQIELGEPDKTVNPYYKGEIPFKTKMGCEKDQQTKERYPCFYFLFANSAVYDSQINGVLDIPMPCDTDIPFEDLEVTSTAGLVGGDIDLSDGDITLAYWGVQVTGLSPSEPAGVLSVRTGQVIFTNAGIEEQRHFDQPFKLFWGEMLANGNINELLFDYNSANQKFDGFLFTPGYVALSELKSGSNGFMQVCGSNHFDYFGAYYLSIQDSLYTGDDPLMMHGGRSIGIMTSAVFGCKSSDLDLKKGWGGELADLDFKIQYDLNDQDGFLGEGTVQLPGHFDHDLTASVQINRSETAISMASRSSTHASLAGTDMGSAAEVWGCITITGHELDCMTLGYTMEQTAQSAFGLWGGEGSMVEVKLVVKPTFTSFSAGGRMYVSMGIGGGKASVDGTILLTADFANSIVTGDMQGSFDFGSLFGGMEANGHVNWYLSPATQYFQGRGEIEIYGRVMGGGASGGIFLGVNVPRDQAWVLLDPSNRYSVNLAGLPASITGVYGFGSVSWSFNFGIFSGGIGIFAGAGAFLDTGSSTSTPALGFPFPYFIANMGVSLDGEILWGLVSASAWVNLQFSVGAANYFQGSAGLEGCVLWVLCASVDVTVRLDQNGFDVY